MDKWNLIIDVEKCEDCNNCFLACKDEHVDNDWPGYAVSQPLHGQLWMNIMRKERGQYPLIDVAYLPVPCMHCDNAPCIKAARDGAVYKRDDGIVIIDPIKAMDQKLHGVVTAVMTLSGIFGTIVMINSMSDTRLGSATIALAIVFAASLVGRCLLERQPRS